MAVLLKWLMLAKRWLMQLEGLGCRMSKPKHCAVCKSMFMPTKPMQSVCGFNCAMSLAASKRARAEKVAMVKQRKADKAKRESLKTRADWLKEAQATANRYARLRDIRAGHGCISCGAPYRGAYGGAFDGGHLRSVGSAPHMRFYLPQIALQCVKCNRYLGGNAIEFRRGLIERHGLEFVERVESMQGSPKWDIDYLKRFKKVIGRRANRIEKRIAA